MTNNLNELFTTDKIKEICLKFGINGDFLGFERVHNGHINDTFAVYFMRDVERKEYILQKLNTFVFKNPEELMDNITSVTEYIRARIKETRATAKRYVLHYQYTDSGKGFYIDGNGGFWRCCKYIDDSVTFNETDDLTVIREAGKAFGEFQRLLADYPVKKLYITIPHFHNTIDRYRLFREAAASDVCGRKAGVIKEINDYFAFEELATKMYKMQRAGELPLRVTHNDTKCNNVLFDGETHEHLAVIDLDTVMPGLTAFDFGDAIRFIANTCAEDENDLSQVKLDLSKYEAFTGGFVSEIKHSITENEKNTMALGALTMTVECGMRFLTDYLNGDVYFKVGYPDHNLVRSRCQLALAKDMCANLDKMNEIVEKYCK